MTAVLGFLTTFFSFAMMLFGEYLKRSSDAAKAQQKYVVDQAEFDSLCSAVLTRIRLQAAKESSQAQNSEKQVDESIAEREKNP
jgi:hypothetical protein